MSLQQQIDNDLKESMKARQAERLGVLRMLKAAVKNLAIEKGGPAVVLEDSEVIAVIRKQVKQRQDSIESFIKGGRPELAAKEQEELQFLNAYLPQQLSPEALTALVKEAIAESGATSKAQMGLAMKVAKEKAAGRADGKALSLEVQRQLA
ncbi:MAG: GatB/YqeY domain-containing protein [Chthoniobacteraceae bacterium]|nr:GatB/YqeY domain-containing protein [Chthoniobacteraceae bacterium]